MDGFLVFFLVVVYFLELGLVDFLVDFFEFVDGLALVLVDNVMVPISFYSFSYPSSGIV
jgi:hypothetical protein